MIAFHQVQPAEDGAAGQPVVQILHLGERVLVWRREVVEAAVVAAGAPAAVLLGHHVEGGGPGTVRAANDAGLLQLPELLLGGGKFGWVQAALRGKHQAACHLDYVLDAMLGLRRPRAALEDPWKFGQKGLNAGIQSKGSTEAADGCAGGGDSAAGTFQDGLVSSSKQHLGAGRGDHQVKKSQKINPQNWSRHIRQEKPVNKFALLP